MPNVTPISEAVNAGITPGERALLAEVDSMGRAERAQNADLQDTKLALKVAQEAVCLLERQIKEMEERTPAGDCGLDTCACYQRGLEEGEQMPRETPGESA